MVEPVPDHRAKWARALGAAVVERAASGVTLRGGSPAGQSRKEPRAAV